MKNMYRFLAALSFATLLMSTAVSAYPSGNTIFRQWYDFIKIPADTAQNFSTNQFTFSFWVWITRLDDWSGLINKGGSDDIYDPEAKTVCINLQLGSSATTPTTQGRTIYGIATIAGNDTLNSYAPNQIVSPLGWRHILFTYDGDSAAVYVNSKLSGDKHKVGGPLSHGCDDLGLYFGLDWPGSVEYTRGCFDEIMIWNKAVSMSDTAAIKRADGIASLSESIQSGLVGYYRFNEDTGSTTQDFSSRNATALIKSAFTPPTWRRIEAGYPTLDTTKLVPSVGIKTSLKSTLSKSLLTIASSGNNRIKLTYKLSSPSDLRIQLLDLSGKTLLTSSLNRMSEGAHISSLQVPSSLNGTYIVKLTTDKTSFQQKFSVVR